MMPQKTPADGPETPNPNHKHPIVITNQEFKELARFSGPHSVSIYLPTGRAGQEEKSRIRAKNAVLLATRKLTKKYGLRSSQADQFLQPAIDLFSNQDFWQDQSDGLALFVGDGHFSFYTCPIDFRSQVYVQDSFYLRPLIPLVNEPPAQFYLLTLSRDDIRFFEATEYSITELELGEEVPSSLEDALRVDDRSRGLTSAGAPGKKAGSNAVFFGRDADHDRKNEELKVYFDRINKGVTNLLCDDKAPLVLAGVSELIPIYREANSYPHLFEQDFVSGNVAKEAVAELQERAWNVVAPFFQEQYQRDIEDFEQKLTQNTAGFGIHTVIPAAINGRVEVLWVDKDHDSFGTYDRETNGITLDPEQENDDSEELLDLAARAAHASGARVYNLPRTDMPRITSGICAIYRYNVDAQTTNL
jgi:hypothetical protein